MCDLGRLELNVSRGQFGRLCRQVYMKVSKQVSMLLCKKVEVNKFTGLLGSGLLMAVANHQCNAANLNQSKAPFQLELSLAQFSPACLMPNLIF